MIYICGPGHGGPGHGRQHVSGRHLHASSIPTSRTMPKACSACSSSFRFPAAFPATPRPETPGSIHEGGELGYSLLHAYGAVFDNPDLLACCVIGDGEAETGPLATSWHSNKFLNPVRDGAVHADSASERIQDRRPHRAARIRDEELADSVHRLRLPAVLRRRP